MNNHRNNHFESLSPEKLPPVQSVRVPHKQYFQNRSNKQPVFSNNNRSFQSNQSQQTQNNSRSLATSANRSFIQQENPMIRSFKQKNDPFEQGFTRSDKIRYQQSPQSKPHQRLHEFCTIASLNHTGYGQPRYFQSQRVQGISDLRQTFQKNKLIQQIVDEKEMIQTNPMLMTNIESLWKMNLLSDKSFKKNSLPKNQHISYVYNDYHSRSTNPGYARNDMGGAIFTR